MAYVLNCRDIGFDCEAVVRAETEEEVLKQVAEHAGNTHGITEVDDELVAKVRAVMREED